MHRVIEREFLDDLPADDQRAVHARRDLRRVNVWMGQARIMAAVLGDAFRRRPPRSIVELGAGDGTFLLRVARRLGPKWKPSVILVDQQELLDARTEAAFAALSWKVRLRRTDVFDWANVETESNDLTIANLFLHHFTNDQLRALFTRVAHLTGFFAACEPRRSTLALRASSLLRLIGCNDVTLHDASASVRAGFADNELSTLWPTDAEWRLEEHGAGWASHFFAAGRGAGQTGLVNSIRHDGPPR
jgi:hypothetical protein